MVKNFIDHILSKPEHKRSQWALGLSVTLSLIIFLSFAFYKGYMSFGGDLAGKAPEPRKQTASVVSAESLSTPIQNTKRTFKAAFEEIGGKYNELKQTVYDVFVPFVTGIEVYERK